MALAYRHLLKDVVVSREARLTTELEESDEALSLSFTDPLPFVLIVLGAIGAGVAGEIGKDLWSGVKAGIKWLWHKKHNERASELAQLFNDLGKLYHLNPAHYPAVLLVFQPVHLTFVVEPGLPKKAVKQAELLIMFPMRKLMNVPLRWNRNRNRWMPVKEAFHSEQGIQKLRKEIKIMNLPKPGGLLRGHFRQSQFPPPFKVDNVLYHSYSWKLQVRDLGAKRAPSITQCCPSRPLISNCQGIPSAIRATL